MNCAETIYNLEWLISQQQMLLSWMGELKQESPNFQACLVAKLEEHERWLAQSIRELTLTTHN